MKQIANCEWVADSLSAYIDNEIDESSRVQFDEHCCRCEKCSNLVSQSTSLGELMRQSELSVDVDAVWDKLSPNLAIVNPTSTLSRPQTKMWGYALLATAASIALIWFVYNNMPSDHQDGLSHDHASLAVDFQEIFTLAKWEPQAAVSKLALKYQGQELGKQEAIDYLGYEPALFHSIPDGFKRVSTHVLNMPCCKCSATICQRPDGTSLIVFEHKNEQPVWFGNSPAIETQCSGTTCKIVESAGQLAVSWKNGDRQLTLIGATDIAEVNQWVEKMKL